MTHINLKRTWSYCEDNFTFLDKLEENSIHACVTDEPYGLKFMGAGWDNEVPSALLWEKVHRVLKPGSFCLVLSSARQDLLAQTIVNLKGGGFKVAFSSIYWAYATGYAKGLNIANKLQIEATGEKPPVLEHPNRKNRSYITSPAIFSQARKDDKVRLTHDKKTRDEYLTDPEARKAEGAFGGYRPKPAVEVVVVAMKPLSEAKYLEQYKANHRGVTWLGRVRIPDEKGIMSGPGGRMYHPKTFGGKSVGGYKVLKKPSVPTEFEKGEDWFPANLLVQDECVGRYSPYFSLDAWFRKRLKRLPKEHQESFPYLFVPKPSKGEKNKKLENTDLPTQSVGEHCLAKHKGKKRDDPEMKNFHPTVKPLILMQYLIELASNPDEIVLDPFNGSGTTTLAAKLSGRVGIGCEFLEKFNNIALGRLTQHKKRVKLDSFF